MIASILAIIGVVLQLIEEKERRKYIDEYLSLQKAYHDEINKILAERDDSAIDSLEFRIKLLANAMAADIGSKNAPLQG